MAKGGFLDYLKSITGDLVDTNGNIRVTPIDSLGKLGLSNNRLKLLSDIVKLVRDTNLITKETKMYIKEKYISIRGVNEALNLAIDKEEDKIKGTTTQSKIQYDKNKLERLFGVSMFSDILTRDCDITKYEKIVAELYVKYSGNDGARKNLMLSIPKDCMQSVINEEDFEEFIKIISPYIKGQIQFIEDNLDINCCGYFNYLLNMPNLTGVDRQRAKRLNTILLGE